MTIRTRQYGLTTILDFQGRFDIGSRHTVLDTVDTAKTGGCQHLAFNLEKVDAMDSAAIGLMVSTHHIFKKMKCRVSMLQPQGSVKKILEACNIQSMITIYTSEAELLADTPVTV